MRKGLLTTEYSPGWYAHMLDELDREMRQKEYEANMVSSMVAEYFLLMDFCHNFLSYMQTKTVCDQITDCFCFGRKKNEALGIEC